MRAEQNAILTDCQAGTPMGDLYRRYWVPAMMTSELPERAGPPVRITLLGEELVAFRDAEGAIGMLDEFCPHRGTSLFFGRNSRLDQVGGPGLRCVYHGWKFDVNGSCVDMPNEPADSSFKSKTKTRAAYPCVERGGVVWVFMGEPGTEPELPELEWVNIPDEQRYISKRMQFSNSVQSMEGGIDASHANVLHQDIALWDTIGEFERFSGNALDASSPNFFVEETDFGLIISAQRRRENGQSYWRFTQWIMPWFSILTHDGSDKTIGAHAWVPIDNERCFTWTINYHPERNVTEEERHYWTKGGGLHSELLPNSLVPTLNRENDYGINRSLQATHSMTGIPNVGMQDAAVQENMGPWVDRDRRHLGSRASRYRERLGAADAPIIAARRLLLAAATSLEKDPTIRPPGLLPEDQRQAFALESQVLPGDADWAAAKAASGAGKERKDRPAQANSD
ncbi:MAG: Rieske 2Fe-2S domain-containing protein [Actinomycetota bacterium]|nr:Rieske 2Fe-2S domain-containing protein [Actinomycetota bacterium]